MSSASNAALWITGDRLCATGHPRTAATRVVPPILCSPTEALLNVAKVLLVGDGEPVAADTVGRARHVIEVVGVRWVERRLERLRSRRRDRGERQARVDPRVVRRVGLQVGGRQ